VSRFNGSQLSVMSTSNRKIVLPEQFSGIGIARYGQLAAGSKETSPDRIRVRAFDGKADNCNFVGIIIKKKHDMCRLLVLRDLMHSVSSSTVRCT
jgi:hypothetical protein